MRSFVFIAVIVLACSCNHKKTDKQPIAEEKPDFFPVTAYLLGQVREINENLKTPIKYITVNNRTDSVFLKFEDLNSQLTEFLHPSIDSTSLAAYFSETKFLDQTVDAFTLTYDPKIKLPDSIKLRHWDVYVDPGTGKVRRIFMVKKIDSNKVLQLTWQSNEWCMTKIIANIADSAVIEREEKITWGY